MIVIPFKKNGERGEVIRNEDGSIIVSHSDEEFSESLRTHLSTLSDSSVVKVEGKARIKTDATISEPHSFDECDDGVLRGMMSAAASFLLTILWDEIEETE